MKSAAVTDEKAKEAIKTATTTGQFSALGKMALFPAFMLACYIALIAYFKTQGRLQAGGNFGRRSARQALSRDCFKKRRRSGATRGGEVCFGGVALNPMAVALRG